MFPCIQEKKEEKKIKAGNGESKFQKEGVRIGKLTHFICLKNSYFLSESYIVSRLFIFTEIRIMKVKDSLGNDNDGNN